MFKAYNLALEPVFYTVRRFVPAHKRYDGRNIALYQVNNYPSLNVMGQTASLNVSAYDIESTWFIIYIFHVMVTLLIGGAVPVPVVRFSRRSAARKAPAVL